MTDLAHSAVESLLGQLSKVVRDQALLLGPLRGDMQFIKDEMESMNGFLLYLAGRPPPGAHKEHGGGGGGHDHQVRAWMKQVRDLAYDTQDCVDLYERGFGSAPRFGAGVWATVRWLPFYLWTIGKRRQVASMIRELKARSRDVGERRLRYGVTAPPPQQFQDNLGHDADADADADAEEDETLLDAFRPDLAYANPVRAIRRESTDELIRWLNEVAAPAKDVTPQNTWKAWLAISKLKKEDISPRPHVLAVVAPDEEELHKLVWQAYHHSSVADLFDSKVWVTISPGISPSSEEGIMVELEAQRRSTSYSLSIKAEAKQGLGLHAQGLKENLFQFTRGKKVLIVVIEDVDHNLQPWDEIEKFLCSSGCSLGSAIIMVKRDSNMPEKLSPGKNLTYSLASFHSKKAEELIRKRYSSKTVEKLALGIMEKCKADSFSMRLLLHVLHSRPSSIQHQLQALSSSREPEGRHTSAGSGMKFYQMKIIKLCYDNLTHVCKNCLLYMSIFPKGTNIRRKSLLKRWVAEGQVKDGDLKGALDMADDCFNELVARELLTDVEMDAGGRVKRFKVLDSVHDFITEVVKDKNFGDQGLPPNLAGHLSVNNGINWQQLQKKTETTKQQGHTSTSSIVCSCLCSSTEPVDQDHLGDKDIGIMTFLELFPAYSRLGQLKVMDLDGCQKLEYRHLKDICNNLFRLRYLSLRKTNVSKLPKEINKLNQLETLDIRQTRVQARTTRHLLLPKLKHLIAGWSSDGNNNMAGSVEMPRYVGGMVMMEELSRVEIPHNGIDRLKYAGTLKHLTKLGVVLEAKEDHVKELIHVTSRLSECLLHLSVWVKPVTATGGSAVMTTADLHQYMDMTPPFLAPNSLQSLSITGITGRLPNWTNGHRNLAEVSLRETSLQETSLRLLGQLDSLRSLRLRRKSYNEDKVCLKSHEFKALRFLVIEESRITSITFDDSAAPMLEKIVWKFNTMETFLGIHHLTKLEELELEGGSVPGSVSKEIEAHPNHPQVKLTKPIDATRQ